MTMAIEVKPKWKKVGILRVSTSKKAVLLALFELENYRWQVINVGDLLDLLSGRRLSISVFERDITV